MLSYIMETITVESYNVELVLFMWHSPDDTTESVAIHSSRLQPSIPFTCHVGNKLQQILHVSFVQV